MAIYVFSRGPTILFHHHNNNIFLFSKASRCKKTVYSANKESDCKYKTLITIPVEKCALCDNHTVSPHSIQFYFLAFLPPNFGRSYCTRASALHLLQNNLVLSSRGPPVVSSFTV